MEKRYEIVYDGNGMVYIAARRENDSLIIIAQGYGSGATYKTDLLRSFVEDLVEDANKGAEVV